MGSPSKKAHYLLLVRLPSASVLRCSNAVREDQFLLTDLRNEILTLKNHQRDHLNQLRNELADQFKREMAAVVAEKEAQFRCQMEAKEAAWRGELNELVQQEQLKERREAALRLDEQRGQWEASLADERRAWQLRLETLVQQVSQLMRERDRLEKSIRDEVENRVQATQQRLVELQKETSSLQAVYELRCEEVRTLRLDVERVGATAAEVLVLRERNHTLNNTVEGQKAQLEAKSLEERRLQAEIATLTGHYKEEILKGRRLSMEKEELQWKLSLHNEPSLNGPATSPNNNHLHQQHSVNHLNNHINNIKTKKTTLPQLHLSAILAQDQAPPPTPSPSPSPSSPSPSSSSPSPSPSPSPLPSLSPSPPPASHGAEDDAGDAPVLHSTPRRRTGDGDSTGDSPELPDSPTVRDFMEKNDSVAYVLELGEQLMRHPQKTPPGSPWMRRRNTLRFSSLRWAKSPTSH